MVRRLVLANFDAGSKFVTFTFAENVKDIDQANREWKKFVQRLRRRYGDFKYLSVIEFQKRGAVHYHMISDLPYVKKK
ncbi:rolling circle replication-associated protein, partial [Lacticaseibacillus rhamnosus]|uniref:rolling circle replication-associated protein n=1 Tax=Lacticaseibacillus rhamnosus TaxID=47715 RepID=UPI003F45DC9C